MDTGFKGLALFAIAIIGLFLLRLAQ